MIFCRHPIQDVLGVVGIVVGDVDQAQGGLLGMAGQTQLGLELGQHQARRHGPLGMGGVGAGKQFHERLTGRRLRTAVFAVVVLGAEGVGAALAEALTGMSMPAAWACCCMSLMVFWAMC